MGNDPEYPLIGLQLNLGGASKRRSSASSDQVLRDSISVHVRRYLICQYLKQSIIPDPAFIALQDKFNDVDVAEIREALQQRRTSSCATYKRAVSDGNVQKEAALLYDENVLVYDDETLLAQDDFLNREEANAETLLKRFEGGLFLHKPSKQFIVAISHHGENNGSTHENRKESIRGLLNGLYIG